MPRATGGILIECEPAIKSIIVHLDSLSGNDFIIEDLDEQHLLGTDGAWLRFFGLGCLTSSEDGALNSSEEEGEGHIDGSQEASLDLIIDGIGELEITDFTADETHDDVPTASEIASNEKSKAPESEIDGSKAPENEVEDSTALTSE
ncbi:transcription factor TFIIH complex subunit Tfb5-domain-containing protein [Lasiosphaeria ovina]|uniref:General transcription and DNA repair factor IIH subunit TFB5 n=1 Tax=Lasiosphaeria ovina TaxID=92902 RepID=A0AAE0KCQ9_9PEZI|nr:transcription factor TFIIH complex subunit Tfb5-domain-containing protein [Lasiosphaeria ovina]